MAESRTACLVKVVLANQIRTHFIARSQFSIGRSTDADLTLIDPTVSRQHAKVEVLDNEIKITDLGSNNGTIVNGTPMKPGTSIIVTPKDAVSFGKSENEVRFTSILAPIELMAPDEQKQAMTITMNSALQDLESEKQQILDIERQRIQQALKSEENELQQQLHNYISHQKTVLEAKINDDLAAAKSRYDQALAQHENQLNLAKEQMTEKFRAEQQSLEKQIETLEQQSRAAAQVIEAEVRQTAEKILNDASLAAKNEINGASELAKKIAHEASVKSNQKFYDTEKQVAAILAEAQSHANLKVEEAKRKAVDDIRAATFAEQEKIVREHRPLIAQLTHQQQEVEAKLFTQQNEFAHKEKLLTDLSSEKAALDQTILEKRLAVTKLVDELDGAHSTIRTANDAQAGLENLKNEIAGAKVNLQNLADETQRKAKQFEDDLAAKKQSSVIEFETFRKIQEDEFHKNKISQLDRLKEAIFQEQQKYRKSVKTRAAKVAAAIEERLIPNLKASLEAQGFNGSLANTLEPIRIAVNETLVNEQFHSQSMSEFTDRDFQKMKSRRLYLKRFAFVALVITGTASVVFHESIYNWLKEIKSTPGADHMIVQRNVESIYTPVQTNDWHDTYTDNILHLRYYYEAKSDSVYQEQWALRLNDLEAARTMKLSEDDMVQFIGTERALIVKLWEQRQGIDAKYLDVGLSAMNQTEIEVAQEMRDILKTDENYNTVKKMEKDFVLQFIKLKYEKPLPRLPAAESKSN